MNKTKISLTAILATLAMTSTLLASSFGSMTTDYVNPSEGSTVKVAVKGIQESYTDTSGGLWEVSGVTLVYSGTLSKCAEIDSDLVTVISPASSKSFSDYWSMDRDTDPSIELYHFQVFPIHLGLNGITQGNLAFSKQRIQVDYKNTSTGSTKHVYYTDYSAGQIARVALTRETLFPCAILYSLPDATSVLTW